MENEGVKSDFDFLFLFQETLSQQAVFSRSSSTLETFSLFSISMSRWSFFFGILKDFNTTLLSRFFENCFTVSYIVARQGNLISQTPIKSSNSTFHILRFKIFWPFFESLNTFNEAYRVTKETHNTQWIPSDTPLEIIRNWSEMLLPWVEKHQVLS